MLKINGSLYKGNIMEQDNEKLIAVVQSNDTFIEFMDAMVGVKQVLEVFDDGREVSYTVSFPVRAQTVYPNVYSIEFSRKPSVTDELTRKIEEQNEAIDALLIMMLEG